MNCAYKRLDLPVTPRNMPWIVLAVAVFVFLAPNVDFAAGLQWHDGQRIAQLTLLSVVLLALVVPGSARDLADTCALLSRRICAALLAAFALGLVSSVAAPLPRWALLEWGLSWLLMIVVFGVAAQYRRIGTRLDQPLVLLMFATAMAYTTSSFVVYVTMLLIGPDYKQIFDIRELYVSFSNRRFFGHVQTMMLPFLLLPAMWWGTTPLRRFVFWIVPAIWWMLVVASGTRGTWVALLVGIVAVALYARAGGRQWIKWQLGGLLTGSACYILFILVIPRWLGQPALLLHRAGEIMTLSLRDVLWRDATAFAAQHPLLGIGPMHYAYSVTAVGAHPHNAVLQWLAEWGVPAALLLTGVCAAAGLVYAGYLRRTVETALSRAAQVQTALLAALAGAAAQAMVDGVLVMPVSQTLLALLSGWAMGIYLAARTVRRNPVRYALVMVFTVIAACAVVYGVVPEMGHLAEREQEFLSGSPPDTVLLPRFWTQGLIGR